MLFESNILKTIASDCAYKIRKALPDKQFFDFPYEHLVLDDFFPQELAQSCLENFPSLSESCWEHQNDKDIEVKYRTTWKSSLIFGRNIRCGKNFKLIHCNGGH